MSLEQVALTVTLAAGGAVLFATHLWIDVRPDRRDPVSLGVALIYLIALYLRPFSMVGSDILVIAVAIAGGTLIGRMLAERGAIVVFCVTIALVDFFSFAGGLTRKIIDDYTAGRSELLRYLAFSVVVEGNVVPLVGVGDLIVLAALYGGLRRSGEPAGLSAAALLAALGVALIVGLRGGGAPALPFVAVVVVGFIGLRHLVDRATRTNTPEPPKR